MLLRVLYLGKLHVVKSLSWPAAGLDDLPPRLELAGGKDPRWDTYSRILNDMTNASHGSIDEVRA